MNYMSQEIPVQKKRNVKVLGLAVVCIILAASLVGVAAVYVNNQSQTTEKDNTITSLNTQIAALQLQISQAPNVTSYVIQNAYLNQQLSNLNDTLTSVNSAYSNLQKIVQLGSSGTMYAQNSFTQDANGTTTIYNDGVDYAGYVVVQVTATANTTYAQVLYTYSTYNFNFTQTIGSSGTAAFPILPSAAVQVIIGNVNQTAANNVTATATYYF